MTTDLISRADAWLACVAEAFTGDGDGFVDSGDAADEAAAIIRGLLAEVVDRPIWIDEYAWPCRLVPVGHADDDPATRGPL